MSLALAKSTIALMTTAKSRGIGNRRLLNRVADLLRLSQLPCSRPQPQPRNQRRRQRHPRNRDKPSASSDGETHCARPERPASRSHRNQPQPSGVNWGKPSLCVTPRPFQGEDQAEGHYQPRATGARCGRSPVRGVRGAVGEPISSHLLYDPHRLAFFYRPVSPCEILGWASITNGAVERSAERSAASPGPGRGILEKPRRRKKRGSNGGERVPQSSRYRERIRG